jgi:hypothetical protein
MNIVPYQPNTDRFQSVGEGHDAQGIYPTSLIPHFLLPNYYSKLG